MAADPMNAVPDGDKASCCKLLQAGSACVWQCVWWERGFFRRLISRHRQSRDVPDGWVLGEHQQIRRPQERRVHQPSFSDPPALASDARDSNLDPSLYTPDSPADDKSSPTVSSSTTVPCPPASSPSPRIPTPRPPAPSSKQRRSPYERPRGGASPPPIATLPTHSGSPSPSAVSSLDRSNVSTPPVGSISASGAGRRSPPGPPQHQQGAPQQQQHYSAYEMPRGYTGGYMYAPPPPPPAQYHPHPDDRSHPAHYGDHPPAQYAPQPFPIAHGGYVPYPLPGTILSAPMAPPQGGGPGGGSVIQVVHTDDAATKLSDRVRRRCFNCCTTDTSTWRRSNLSPGKVLCNKCGLFERTHSRPRPEQFPHKRGPLASSTLRSRSPQQTQATYQASPQCPPPGFLGFTLPPVSPSSYREVLESENPRNDLERQAPFNPEVIDMDECPIALSLCEVSETTVGGPKLEGGQTTVVDVASQNDGTTQQIPESGDPSQTLPLSSPMALEEVPGTRLDTANISTFIIWSPKSAPLRL
ncbi:GATA type zinc finger protein asd-4 [Mycena venus]|uniref:GATA type zinc finger protein asd-4 n=1 Tax=Mycena venus TaxID=2733690 RepID=A0A8H6YB93_9AGAR|nr:GATA type zinc finger protein asd-4 [Mycena venus]